MSGIEPSKLLELSGKIASVNSVIFKTISCMCDNVHYLTFKKNNDGDFKMSGNGFALSNFSMKHPIHDIEWEADENEWGGVVAMINSGTSVVEEVKSR